MSDLNLKDSLKSFVPVQSGGYGRFKSRVRFYLIVFIAWLIGLLMGAFLMYCKLAIHVLSRLGMFGH